MMPLSIPGKLRVSVQAFVSALILCSCAWLNPQVESGQVLFQDDFAINTSGWDRYRDSVYEANYNQGSYLIKVNSADTMAWSLPDLSYSDVVLRVQAWRSGGPEDNLYGLICRYQDADNFIFFVLSSDGYMGIGRYLDGDRELLTDESLLPFEGIRPNENINLIEAYCVGENLTLTINGEQAAQAQTDWLIAGDVGLLAGTYSEPDVEIRFDNFSMLQP
ncbi:MAG: hypothetical protein PVI81_00845 [Anaerolineales bacterium]|jgi:hypothetical protein